MTRRTTALQRLAQVQRQMVRLSEWRVAAAERTCRELAEDREHLVSYVVEEGALGVTLAKAALRSLHGLDRRLAVAEQQRDTGKAALAVAKRREHLVDALAEEAKIEAKRLEERAALAETIEGWLVARQTSLP